MYSLSHPAYSVSFSAPASNARSGLGVTLQKVQGHLAKYRPVAYRRLVTNTTLVLIEGHIEYPTSTSLCKLFSMDQWRRAASSNTGSSASRLDRK